jgi:Family of unknown function (DUF6390)
MIDRASGPLLFARYAFQPNHYGYCGPEDADGFFRSGVAGDDHGLRARARNFDGALPHLQLIADAVDHSDPPDILDRRVVEAYWLGSAVLDQVNADRIRPSISAAFAGRCGPLFTDLAQALASGALPHHSFVVFASIPGCRCLPIPGVRQRQ